MTAPKLSSNQTSSVKVRSKPTNYMQSGTAILGEGKNEDDGSEQITYMQSGTAILGEGKSEDDRFTKLAVKGREEPVLVSYKRLATNKKAAIAQLTAQGARLLRVCPVTSCGITKPSEHKAD